MADVRLFDEAQELARQAALCGAETIRTAIQERGQAVIVLATGSSQIEMLAALVREPDIDWSKVEAFHLDEYIGLARTHSACFRHYLHTHFIEPLNVKPIFHEIRGEAEPAQEIERLRGLIEEKDIALCFAGIGNNCHLAFNDPPADFVTTAPYLLVELDEDCRRQQVEGGWFASMEEVPHQAITMSIHQILKAQRIIVLAQGARKADSVSHALQAQVSPSYPASILQWHRGDALWFLDRDASAKLERF